MRITMVAIAVLAAFALGRASAPDPSPMLRVRAEAATRHAESVEEECADLIEAAVVAASRRLQGEGQFRRLFRVPDGACTWTYCDDVQLKALAKMMARPSITRYQNHAHYERVQDALHHGREIPIEPIPGIFGEED